MGGWEGLFHHHRSGNILSTAVDELISPQYTTVEHPILIYINEVYTIKLPAYSNVLLHNINTPQVSKKELLQIINKLYLFVTKQKISQL